MRTVSSPGEEVLSTFLDDLLPLINLTDLPQKMRSDCHDDWVPAYPTFLNPACSNRRAAFWTTWKGVGDAFTNLTKREAASGATVLIIVTSCEINTTARGGGRTLHFLRLRSAGHSPPTISGNPLSHPSVSFIPFPFSLRVFPTRPLIIGGLRT